MLNKIKAQEVYPTDIIPYRKERNGIVCLCDGCDPTSCKVVLGRDMRQHKVCTGYEECSRCGFNLRVMEDRKRQVRRNGLQIINGRKTVIFSRDLAV